MPWRPVLAGLAASLAGIGLGRFAYGPLLPAVVAGGWFSPGAAAYLGAANLAGYLLGAACARAAAARFGLRPVLRAMMAAVALSFAACAAPLPFAWFFGWRLLSGLAGGALMVLAGPAVLQQVPAERRGVAGGVIFTGVGLGVAASGTLVPLLLRFGLPAAWLGLAAACLALAALAWRALPAAMPPAATGALPPVSRALRALWAVYGLCAVALVPFMVFLVDYVARGLGRGMVAGSLDWVLLGAGAMAGPVAAGWVADRLGSRATIRLLLAVLAAALLAVAASPGPVVVALAAAAAGATMPGFLPVLLGRVHELAGPDPRARQRGWSGVTIAFGIGQAAAAYGMAFAYVRTGSYTLLFAAGAAAAGAALLIDAVPGKGTASP